MTKTSTTNCVLRAYEQSRISEATGLEQTSHLLHDLNGSKDVNSPTSSVTNRIYFFGTPEKSEGANSYRRMKKGITRTITLWMLVITAALGFSSTAIAQDVDLALTKSISNSTPEVGDQITYTIFVVNKDVTTATGIQILDQTPFGAINNISFTAEAGSTSYNVSNGEITWNIASLAGGDSLRLEIVADVVARGVFFNIAEITAIDQTDYDSQPGNSDLSEDDLASSCFSVPIYWYPGDEYRVTIPAPFNPGTGITWFRDGIEIDGSTIGASVSNDTLLIQSPGSYTFTTLVNTCPASGCCAIIMLQGPYGEIGDFVWEDTNRDGIQDIGEPGIANQRVYLWDDGGALLDSTLTDINGIYLFDSLEDGNYIVQFTAPANYQFTSAGAGNGTNDSDADNLGTTSAVTISTLDANSNPRLAGDTNRFNNLVDAGVMPDLIFDLALSKTVASSAPYLPGQNITYNLQITNEGQQNATDIKLIDYVPAGLILSDTAWQMVGQNAQLIDSVTVAAGASLIVPVTFQISPSYSSTSLTNTAEILRASGPAGEAVTDNDSSPNNNIGSEDDQDSTTIPVTITGSIGDFVWNDLDEDGVQDPGEPGISGVNITLETSTGTFVASTVTDGNGNYLFAGLPAGDYIVRFNSPSSSTTSPSNQTIDANDSDVDVVTGESQIITLAAGETNLTVDAGYYFAPTCESIATAVSANASICVNESTNLTATTTDGSAINWYYSPSGGAPIFNSNSGEAFTVSPTTTTTYYAAIATAQPGCPQTREPVTVVVNVIPPDPTVDGPVEVCTSETANLNNAIVSSPYTTGGVHEWHTGSSPSSPLVTDPSAAPAGNYYLFELSVNGCYSNPTLLRVIERTCQQFIDLSVIKIADTRLVEVGDIVTFTIELKNDGPDTATNVVLRDQLPSGLEFVSSTNFAETSGGELLATFPTILAGQTITFTYSTRVTSTSGSIVNVVQVMSADQTDVDSTPGNAATTNEDDDDDEVITLINPAPSIDLSLIKLVSFETPSRGDLINFTIAVTNSGAIAATNVEVQDALPAGFTYINSTGGTSRSFANNTVTATWNTIAPGQTVRLDIQATADSVGVFTNHAQVTNADQQDSDSTPNNGVANGEDDTDSADISVSDTCNPTTPAIAALSTTLCTGGSTQLTAVGCNGTVTWSDGQTGNTVTVSPVANTSYTAYCTVGSCNSPMSNSLTVNVVNVTAPVISTSSPTVCSGDAALLTAAGCAGTVNWSNGQSGTVISVSPVVTTSYTATCSIGSCVSTPSNSVEVQVITSLPAPAVAVDFSQICPGDDATLTATGCAGTVTWSNGQTGASIVVSPVSNTSYTATCTVNSCTSPASTTLQIIVITTVNPPAIAAGSNQVCRGDSTTLNAAGCSGLVTWSNGQTGNSIVVAPTVNTSYTAICSAGTCTSATSNSVLVTVNNGGETPILSATATSVCFGAEVIITASGCTQNIVWNTGDTTSQITVNPTSSTLYSATCGTGICAGTSLISISVISGGQVAIAQTSNSICSGQSVTLTAAGCTSGLVWSTGATTSAITVQPDSTQSYSVTCGTGICATSDTATVVVGTGTPLSITASSSTVCSGESVNLTVTGCTELVTWSTGQTGANINVAPVATTSYSAVCGSGACASTGSVIISVTSASSTVNITASTNNICAGESVTLSATGCTTSLIWSNGATSNATTVTPTATQSYTVTCGSGACQTSDTVVITVNTLTIPSATALNNTCPAEYVDLTDAVTSSPVTSGGTFVFRTGSSPASPAVSNPDSVVTSGTYFVFERSTSGCFSPGRSIAVTIVDCDTIDCITNPATAFAGNDTTICLSDDFIVLNGTIGGAASSSVWSTNGSGRFLNASQRNTRYYFSHEDIVDGSISFTLTTNDPDGTGTCTAAASTMDVTINADTRKPTISASNTTFICLGDTTVLTVNQNAPAYLWSTGDTTKSISVTAAGSFWVKLINASGCASISSDTVRVNTNATIPAPAVDDLANNTCPSTTVNLLDQLNSNAATTGGIFEFHTGILPTSPLVANVSSVGAGNYYVFEKTTSGCYSNPSLIRVVITNCSDTTSSTDVGILIVGDKAQTVVDGLVTFTITVRNNGPSVATNVAFENDVPTSLAIQGNPTGLTRNANVLSAVIPILQVNQQVSFNYTVRVLEDGEITSVARITDLDQNDSFAPNNISSFTLFCSTCQEVCVATSLKADTIRQQNGSLNIRFTALLQNCGNVDLKKLSLEADLAEMFGTTPTYSMVQAPTPSTGSGLVPNSSFNGDTNIQLLDSTSVLHGSDIDTLTWVINLLPNGTEGPYSINTRIKGVGETIFAGVTLDATDISNDGLFVIKASSTPTVVKLYDSPSIGLALAIIDTTNRADGSINVTYQAIVKNNGAINLSNVIVSDSLFATYFAPASYTMVSGPEVNSTSTLIANEDYNGTSDVNLTLSSSILPIGKSDTIWFTINVLPDVIREFPNQAIAEGTGTLTSGGQETVRDISNDGFNPDIAGENPTVLDLGEEPAPCIGLALYVGDSVKLEDGSFDITYYALIKNCGNVTLTNVSLCDSLTPDFPSPSVAILKNGPSLGVGSTLAVDTSYNGTSNMCMLNEAGSTLALNKVDTVKWTINLTLNGFNGPFRKNVTGTALAPDSITVSDISNDGMNPDPAGEAPTVLNFNNLPPDIIGLAKELVDIESVGGTVYDVFFKFVIKNYGIINFTGVQLQDNIAETFGDKVSVDSVRVYDTSSGIVANPTFTGKGNLIDMLVDSLSILPRNGSETVSLMVRVDLAEADTLVYENMALAVGYHNGTSTDDQSTTGNNPDPDADGTPYNNTIPTVIDFRSIVPVNITPIGIAKQVIDTLSVVDGSYEITYRFVVRNYGDTLLTNIQVTDSLSTVFADSTDWSVVSGPQLLSDSSTLVVNGNFDGITDLNLLVADSSSLAVGASDTITLKIKVRNNASSAQTYLNTAYAEATYRGDIVTDMSTTGLNPDPDGDNNPGDDNDSTPVALPGADNGPSENGIVIPGGISPNGDGLNDALVIEGLSTGDSLQMWIYNRWGELVFYSENYKRDYPGANDGWDGKANSGIRLEKGDTKLPDGTYFFRAESNNPKLLKGEPYYNFITIAGSGTE